MTGCLYVSRKCLIASNLDLWCGVYQCLAPIYVHHVIVLYLSISSYLAVLFFMWSMCQLWYFVCCPSDSCTILSVVHVPPVIFCLLSIWQLYYFVCGQCATGDILSAVHLTAVLFCPWSMCHLWYVVCCPPDSCTILSHSYSEVRRVDTILGSRVHML